MKHFSLRTLAALLPTLLIICLPLVGLAQGPTGCTGSSCKLLNPLSVNNFCDLIKVVLDAILVIGMPIAVLFLVYVGFGFIWAQGNMEKVKTARHNLLNTVIGIAIFLGAWTIAKIIQSTLVGLGATGAQQC